MRRSAYTKLRWSIVSICGFQVQERHESSDHLRRKVEKAEDWRVSVCLLQSFNVIPSSWIQIPHMEPTVGNETSQFHLSTRLILDGRPDGTNRTRDVLESQYWKALLLIVFHAQNPASMLLT